MTKKLFAPLTLALLAACGQQSETSNSSNAASQTAAVPVAATKPTGPLKGKYLTLEEGIVDLCKHPQGLMATQVTWDARPAGATDIEIWLQSPGEERKLWAATIASGTERTGEWLRNGSQVFLVNHADKVELEALTITEQPCTQP